MHFVRLAALSLITATLAACSFTEPGMFLEDDVWFEDGDWDYGYDRGTVTGRMAGEMPEVGDFESNEVFGSNYSSSDWLSMDMHAVGDHGWAMLIVSAQIDENGEVRVEEGSVVGCSGPDEGIADFDEPATDMDIDVDTITIDGEDIMQVEVIAEFDSTGVVTAVAQVPVQEF